jgi:hypothetical protein
MLGLCGNVQAQRIPRLPRLHFNNKNKVEQNIWKEGYRLEIYEKVSHELAVNVMGIQGTTEVAFSYQLYQLLGWSLWTRNGHYILLVDGRRHVEPTEDQWRALIGDLPTSRFSKPIWYQIPTWPIFLGVFVTYKAARRFVFQTEQEKLKILGRDRRYQVARETFFRNEEGEEVLVTRLDDRRYATAKNVLLDQGVQPNKADTNLQLLLQAEIKENNRWITQGFQSGEALEEREKWEDCVELYSELAKLIPLDDARQQKAKERLDLAKRMLAVTQPYRSTTSAIATNEDDEAVPGDER